MRISRTVKKYIEDEVYTRLLPKYEADKAEAERRDALRDKALEEATMAGLKAVRQVIDKVMADEPDILEINHERLESFYVGGAVGCKNRFSADSCFNWEYRLRKERDSIVQNIIVELELGGTKADLERMLSEIGGES